jgi:hypothetical protein
MVQLQEQPQVTWELISPTGDRTRQLYLILYPKELEDEIIQALEATGVPGYTEFPKMIGRGRKIKHFDNPVWPGATGAVFTVVTAEQARQLLLPTFEALASSLETRSNGLYGLHMFALPCEQLI